MKVFFWRMKYSWKLNFQSKPVEQVFSLMWFCLSHFWNLHIQVSPLYIVKIHDQGKPFGGSCIWDLALLYLCQITDFFFSKFCQITWFHINYEGLNSKVTSMLVYKIVEGHSFLVITDSWHSMTCPDKVKLPYLCISVAPLIFFPLEVVLGPCQHPCTDIARDQTTDLTL